MVNNADINRILDISESFELPEKMMNILLSDKKDKTFDEFKKLENDMSYDWFNEYFQEEHSNRNAMMQDFTPRELAELLPNLSNGFEKVLDICAGTGGLTVGAWNINPGAFFVCEELSKRAIPLLLFNLAIRNMKGYVINKDVLSGEVLSVYRLKNGENYSEIIEEKNDPEITDFDLIITNPP